MSIPNTAVCDFNINCDNGEDEQNCDNDTRFHCLEGNPTFVSEIKVYATLPNFHVSVCDIVLQDQYCHNALFLFDTLGLKLSVPKVSYPSQ